jgi:hypothetical protein
MAVTILSMLMMAAAAIVITSRVLTVATAPTFRLGSSQREPNLEKDAKDKFHAFISHSWSTGQDQTHTVVRKLQLLLPGIRIWLDVEQMDDVGKLEEEVLQASVFILFLSTGYFESYNCRRELYAALRAGKPIIVIREDNPARGGASLEHFKKLCSLYCSGGGASGAADAEAYPGPKSDLLRLFPAHDPPIVWTRVHDFQVESTLSTHAPGSPRPTCYLAPRCFFDSTPFFAHVPARAQTHTHIHRYSAPPIRSILSESRSYPLLIFHQVQSWNKS